MNKKITWEGTNAHPSSEQYYLARVILEQTKKMSSAPVEVLKQKKATAYGSFSFSILLIHNVFLIFYVKMFLSVYQIDQTAFFYGQGIFMIWNSFNDPVVGWLMDLAGVSKTPKDVSRTASEAQYNVICLRIKALSVGGILFSLSFVLFWVPWCTPAVQFVLAVCVYDTFLTYVDLSHTSLLAELTVDGSERARMSSSVSTFSISACLSVFFAYYVWDDENHWPFTFLCLGLSLLSGCGFYFSGKYLQRLVDFEFESVCGSLDGDERRHGVGERVAKGRGMIAFLREIVDQKNFVWFSLMNLIQVFHCHFNSNFFPFFLQQLLQDHLSQTICGLLLGLSFVVPHLNNIYFSALSETKGVYIVIKYLFLTKLALALFVLMAGEQNLTVIGLFIVSNRIFTEGTCKLLNLVIADLIDEDWVVHRRTTSVSAFIFGLSNLISKPGQTLAPVVGTWILDHSSSVRDEFTVNEKNGALQIENNGSVFNLLVYVPIGCAVCQLVIWSRFSLHGQKLRNVRRKVAEMKGRLTEQQIV